MIANQSDSRFRYPLDLQLFAEGDPAPAEPAAQPPEASEPPAPEPGAQPPQPEGEPKGLKIKFNKEERFVPDEELPTWVQKGFNHDRLQERVKSLETQSQMLDRVARFYGHEDYESFAQAFEEAERVERAKEEARRLGMDEKLYQQFLQPINEKLSEAEKTIQSFQKQEALRQIDAEVAKLKSQHPDFDQYQDKVFELALGNGYSLEDAYIIASHKDKLAAAQQQAEQEALEKLKQNAESTPGSLGNGNTENTGYATMTDAEKRAFREKVKRGEV